MTRLPQQPRWAVGTPRVVDSAGGYLFVIAETASSAGTETSAEQFRKNPEVLCSSISWESESDRTVWVYKVRLENLAEPPTSPALCTCRVVRVPVGTCKHPLPRCKTRLGMATTAA